MGLSEKRLRLGSESEKRCEEPRVNASRQEANFLSGGLPFDGTGLICGRELNTQLLLGGDVAEIG